MRFTEMINLLVLVVVSEEPVEDPTVKPEKVIAPAEAPFVTITSTSQSDEGAAKVCAPLLV